MYIYTCLYTHTCSIRALTDARSKRDAVINFALKQAYICRMYTVSGGIHTAFGYIHSICGKVW